MQKPGAYISTSGWSYKHWKGIFYPDKLKPAGWLDYYLQHFNVTELNASFYHLPKAGTTAMWAEKTPADFRLCPKMSRYLTHMKKLNEPEETLQHFFDVFTPLKKKLGPVLVQLPPFLKYNEEKAEALYRLFKKKYSYYRFAMEVRHDTWLSEQSIGLMKEYNIALVVSQSGSGFPYSELVTAQHIYIRFHGPGALYASSYSNEQLQHYAALFKEWIGAGHTIWAFFNNDIHGFAIGDAKRLREMTGIS